MPDRSGQRVDVAREYYPVFFDLQNRSVLVIGGGRLALEKVNGLLAAKARITVISPRLIEKLAILRDAGQLEHLAREYESGDMQGHALVMAAADDPSPNAALHAAARDAGVPLNAADDPANCDFILPAVVREPPLTLAISTGGGSPAMARRVREELSDYLNAETSSLAELVAEVRAELREQGTFRSIPPERWQTAMDGQVRILLAQRRRDEAKALFLSRLSTTVAASDE